MTRPAKDAGFTLVELLTVLVIIGLMASAVVMAIPRAKPAINTHTENALLGLNRAAQKSLVSGRPQAWGLSKDGYAIYDFVDGEWLKTASADWPDSLRIEFIRQNAEIKLGDEILPLVVFEPTGLSTPFELRLEDGSRQEILRSAGDGRVTRGEAS